MGMSDYIRKLRAKIGKDLLLAPGVVALIRDDQDRILLIRRSDDDSWDLPAGLIDPGETPAQAVRREVREETGCEIEPERILGVLGGEAYRHTYPDGNQVEPLIVVFACRLLSGEPCPDQDEVSEIAFLQQSELPELMQPYPAWIWDPECREAGFET